MTYSPLADQDLLDIFVYIAAEDPVAASRFIRDLTRKIEWIALSGFPGVPRNELSPGLKALPYRNRCIYFRTTEKTVRILRVLHGHQDVSSGHFKTDET
ncbi:type II toxin-antitoxin system RelE/ParE family toxin [Rhizobium terrae]|uniref:type II toxin-antitoxin system RelE/ParE family toxin n=1 Tax=Rhizobium terrae TaxID=2171756 RepID=UPI000E3D54BB|nr:type II toxin-antitoxin system RelE/ParE family toxin [Rhizobium terrae]